MLPRFNINPYVQPYVGGANQELGNVIDQRIAQYDANQEHDDVLGYQTDVLLQNVAPFEGDINYAKQLMHDTRQQLASRADSGDYENMGREVKRSARNFAAQVQPLLENQKRVGEYQKNMDELYRSGKISIDTYSKAKATSLNNYKGINPNNIQGTMFNGFVPSADVNVSDKVDKFLKDWKENGGARIIPDGQGGYTKIDWTNASEKEIQAAATEYLQGDSDFTNYAQTQAGIGNTPRIVDEATNAINFGMKKYGFYKEDKSLQWEPEYINSGKKALQFAQNLHTTPSSATVNPNAIDIFDASGTNIDDQGKVILSDLVQKRNGKYYQYTDPKGNTITPAEYAKNVVNVSGGTGGAGVSVNNRGYKEVEISPDQATTYTKDLNNQLVTMASERFLNEAIKSGKISTSDMLNNKEFVDNYLRINQKKYTNPEYLKQTGKEYKEAITNSANITDNRRWDISTIPGAVSPETTSVKDDDILANLTGQSIGILSTDNIGGFRKGQKADLNSMLDKFTEDGFSIKSVRKLGPTKFNPFSNQPGMSYAFTLEDKDGKTKTIETVASINDSDLQPVQDVYNLSYKGMSGNIPFNAPNSPLGSVSGSFRVRTATDVDPQDGKRKFASFVEILDSKGNKINIQGFPQNIPISQFADIYKDIFAPNAINKYVKTK